MTPLHLITNANWVFFRSKGLSASGDALKCLENHHSNLHKFVVTLYATTVPAAAPVMAAAALRREKVYSLSAMHHANL